jgi:hypothetical protein
MYVQPADHERRADERQETWSIVGDHAQAVAGTPEEPHRDGVPSLTGDGSMRDDDVGFVLFRVYLRQ